MPSPLRPHAWLIVAVTTLGCGSSRDRTQAELEPVPDTPASLAVEVGTGVDEFAALANGEPVDLTYGPQGGFHIWTAVRMLDATVLQVQINISTRFEASGAPAGSASRWPAEPVLREGARVHVGMRNFVAQASEVAGKRIVVRAEVIAGDGRHGAGERVVVPRFK